MSNTKTIIPGINDNPTSGMPLSPVPQPFGATSTVIPGVSPMASVTTVQQENKGQIFGFLFSVSKTLAGEYWPLMLGANTIGRGDGNSIILGEGTVSDQHASIHVISRAGKLIVYIRDDKSKTGTLLNGNLLRGEADLSNGDIITVGEQYELLVILVNAVSLGLEPKPNFKAVNPIVQPGHPSFGPACTGVPQFPRPSQVGTVVEGCSGPAPIGGHTVVLGGIK